MVMGVPVKNFLKSRKDRAVGSILGWVERNVKHKMTQAEWESFRQVVLDATNSYHDVVLDLLKSEDESVIRNDALIEILERNFQNMGSKLMEQLTSVPVDTRR